MLAIAKEWAKPGVDVIEELKRLFAKLPKAPSGMTEKNRALLVKLSDEAIVEGLVQLPDKILALLPKKKKWTIRDHVAAQLAVAIDIQLHCALRMQNLISLEFGTHIRMPARPGEKVFISLRSEEMKNDHSALFELPSDTIARIRFYRKIVRSVIGHRGKILFVNKTGTRKSPATLAQQLKERVQKHLGLDVTPHQYRHILGKFILDDKSGQIEEVKNHLRHKSSKTTVSYYAELDTLQSSRSHNKLIDKLRKGKLGDDE
ncbi:MAG: site-specific integrase [Hyphomicrobiales bacterium]